MASDSHRALEMGTSVLPAMQREPGKEINRVSPYELAFNRIRAEFVEMPGMQLKPEQVERLSGIGSTVCQRVLDDLVRAGLLSRGADGTYARAT